MASALAVYNPVTTGISSIYIIDAGAGYGSTPAVTLTTPQNFSGSGDYLFNEYIYGATSNTFARVKNWNNVDTVLDVSFVSVESDNRIAQSSFTPGELIVGAASSAIYSLVSYDSNDVENSDKYMENDEIEEAADLIIDFSESNPFGAF